MAVSRGWGWLSLGSQGPRGKGAPRGVSPVETLSLVRGGASGRSSACLSLLLPLLRLESVLNSRVEKRFKSRKAVPLLPLLAIGFYNSVPW